MSNQVGKLPVQVNREQLYHQVWQTPMSKLTSTHGISAVSQISEMASTPHSRSLLIEREQLRKYIFVAQVAGPAVSGGDSDVQRFMGVR